MNRKDRSEKITEFALAVVGITAIFLRAFYVYYTPSWRRQHDVIGFGTGEGQAAFIEFFYGGHVLLDFDPREKWGFFQPPLHHMVAALWIRIQELFGIGYDAACEHVQVLTLIYSLIALWAAFLIFKYFGLEKKALLLAFTITAIHPGFILMSGSVNNDMAAIMFTLLTVYYSLRWYDDRSWKHTIILALFIGMGMMTKLSVALVVPATALLFVVRMVQGGADGFVRYMKQLVVFTFICGPIALWSPIRNYILFKVPFGYTPEVGEPVERPLLARLFDIRSSIPYVSRISNGDQYDEFNIFLGMLKTSFFGDENFAYEIARTGHSGLGRSVFMGLGWAVFISGAILAVLGIYAVCRVLFSERYIKDPVIRAYLGTVLTVSMIMYISFMFKSPYSSSMDFRYVIYLIPVCAVMMGMYADKGEKWFGVGAAALTVLFAGSSVATYLLLCLA
ncbi:MAG: glycosyltransferase family 39 protein [Lachnospiraceae bacterium]|nr:glycosyltransferase family 39 protein [Lachnospiraceae bacterium]